VAVVLVRLLLALWHQTAQSRDSLLNARLVRLLLALWHQTAQSRDSLLKTRPLRFQHEGGLELEGLLPELAGQPSGQRFLLREQPLRHALVRQVAVHHHLAAARLRRHLGRHLAAVQVAAQVAGAFPLDKTVQV